MRYFWFLIVFFVSSSFAISQVNYIERQYLQDWLVLGSFPSHELDVTSLPIPKEGTVITGTDEKTRTWKRLKSVYKNAHLYPFYQEQTDSTLYLFSQIESSKNQIIYLTFTGINYQDQLWVNETEIEIQASNTTYTYPIEVHLKSGLNVIYLKVSSDIILCQMWDPLKIGTITGQVTNSNGHQVAGAEINLLLDDRSIYRTVADNEGRYRIVMEPLFDKFDLSVQKGELGAWYFGISTEERKTVEVNLSIRPSVSLSGLLVNFSEKPHTNVVVEAIPKKYLTDESGNYGSYAVSDTNGRYRFINLKPDIYYLRCHNLNQYIYHREQKNPKSILISRKSSHQEIDFKFGDFKKGTWRSHSYLNGIGHPNVYTVHKSRDGNMWFGTANGVTRYDGGLYTNLGDKDGMTIVNFDTFAGISDISESHDGRIWFASQKGLYFFIDNNFSEVEDLAGKSVTKILVDKNQTIWAATNEGLWFIKKGVVDEFSELPLARIFDLIQDLEGNLWITTSAGVFVYDGKKLERFPLIDWKIEKIALGIGKKVYLIGDGNVWSYDNEKVKKLSFPTTVYDVIQTGDDGDWFLTGQGFSFEATYGPLFLNGNNFVIYSQVDGLARNSVVDIYHGSDGIIWFSINGAGVSQYDTQSFYSLNIKDGLTDYRVNAIYQDKEDLMWFGTRSGGLNIWSENSIHTFTTKDGLASDYVNSIFADNEGQMWITSGWGYLNQLQLLSSGLSNFETLNYSLNASPYRARDGTIWFSAEQGIGKYQEGEISFLDEELLPESNANFVPILEDQWGNLWFRDLAGSNLGCFSKGLFVIVPELAIIGNGFFNPVVSKDGNLVFPTPRSGAGLYEYSHRNRKINHITVEDGLPTNDLKCVYYQDEDEILWIGTNGAGVAGYDGRAWTTIDTRDGLNDDTVRVIYEDKDGYLWFASTRYQRQIREPKIQIDKVVTNKEYSDFSRAISAVVGERISIYYHAIDFITLPEKRQYRYKLIDLSLRLNEQSSTHWSQQTSEAFFERRFNKSGRYQFQIQTIDRDLNYSTPATVMLNVVTPWYLNGWIVIPSGSGILVLIAFSIISGYRYQLKRREAQQLRDQMLEQERQNNEALTESYEYLKQAQDQLVQTEKMASLGALTAGIAHEIRNPLNFVNNFAELSSELTQELLAELEDQKEKLDSDSLEEIEDILDSLGLNLSKIDEHGRRADSIVNGMLLHSRGVSGERSATDLNALLEEYVNLAYHGLRAQDTSFNITIERDYDESLEQVSVVPQDISRVFLNILNNACYAAHQRAQAAEEGFAPTLWVRTKGVSDQVQVGIKDNGTGIPEEISNKIFEPFMTTKPTGSGTGLGLSISYEIIVDEHQGQIDVDTREGEYTEFIITLPKNSEPESG